MMSRLQAFVEIIYSNGKKMFYKQESAVIRPHKINL